MSMAGTMWIQGVPTSSSMEVYLPNGCGRSAPSSQIMSRTTLLWLPCAFASAQVSRPAFDVAESAMAGSTNMACMPHVVRLAKAHEGTMRSEMLSSIWRGLPTRHPRKRFLACLTLHRVYARPMFLLLQCLQAVFLPSMLGLLPSRRSMLKLIAQNPCRCGSARHIHGTCRLSRQRVSSTDRLSGVAGAGSIRTPLLC